MTLRDELAELVMTDEVRPMASCSCSECGESVADAVLGCEAMQALRSFVAWVAHDRGYSGGAADWLAAWLPPSVVAWVLDGDA